MRFHIQNHHTPENCGTHLEERKKALTPSQIGPHGARNWESNTWLVVLVALSIRAFDMAKVTELMRPTMGRDECVITPVTER